MKRYTELFKTIFIKEFIEWKRYAFNTVMHLVSFYFMFLILFMGLNFAMGPGNSRFGSAVEGLIVGFFIWNYGSFAYITLTWKVIEESRSGTLEQIYMNPFGFEWIAFSIVLSDFILEMLFIIPMLILMMLTTGHYLNIDIITLLPIVFVTITAAYGLGFIMAGLGLVFKKIQSLTMILQFILLAFIAAPADKFPLFKLIFPFTMGTQLIRSNMVDKVTIFEMPLADLGTLLLNSAFYLTIGFIIFKICERKAKEKGLLGHY